MGPGANDDLPDNDVFETNYPLSEEIGCTSSSEEEEDDPGCMRPKRPRLEKPWSGLLFSKARLEVTPSVLLGIQPEYELDFRRYLAETILTLVQKLQLSLDIFSSAVLLMQRFLMYRSVQTIDKRKLALACVFLASKTNEDRRPPIVNFVTTFYRLRYRHELNPTTETGLYSRLYNDLLFWESQILCVLGFNIYYNLREVRREIDVYCEDQVRIPRSVLRTALCVFVLNTLALTTLPVRCSYQVIYLASISISMAWAGLKEPRELSNNAMWWQFVCPPNNPTMTEFESIKEEILETFQKTRTKFHEYFLNRQNSSSASTPRHSSSNGHSKSNHSRSHGSSNSTGNNNRPSTSLSQQSNAEGLTGTPLINSGHQNGVPAASAQGDRSQSGHHVGSQPSRSHDPNYIDKHSHLHAQSSLHHRSQANELVTNKHTGEHASSSYSHKHHRHYSRHRDRSSGSGEHRSSKDRRSSGSEKHHRHRSRSRHRHDSDIEEASGPEAEPDDSIFAVSWDQQTSQAQEKLKIERNKRVQRPV